MTIQKLIGKIKEKNPDANIKIVEQAYEFAKKAHRGQKRKSGEDFITHPLSVAYYLAYMNIDEIAICAALLHDTVEDAEISFDTIKKEFGQETANLVKGVTKLKKIKYSLKKNNAKDLHQLFFVMAKDIRAALIKLADRFHNMKTLEYMDPAQRKEKALETMDIYAPIADRLGMGEMKGQLEDLSFPYLFPKEYERVQNLIKEKNEKRLEYLKKVNDVLTETMLREKIKIINIHSRPKHLFSLYKKLLRYDWDITKVYDLIAVRIIVESVNDCYAVLGIIHKHWRPLPGYIKDFIAVPKLNGYKSLHTTIFCLEGKILEIQIRTPMMHKEAELGIAAHWAYSEQQYSKKYIKNKITAPSQTELIWVKQLRDWQKEEKSDKEFIRYLKSDFFGDRILVFTPKGDIVNLPNGATPVDFAYAIHTDVGNRCTGAKVNGKIVTLNYELKNEDIVDIIISPDIKKGPSRDWLGFVKTGVAKNRINAWINANYVPYGKLIQNEIERVANKLVTIVKVASPKKTKDLALPAPLTATTRKIKIDGHRYLLTTIAKCCNPAYQDRISGYITALKIIKIHKTDCATLKTKDQKKIIPAKWE